MKLALLGATGFVGSALLKEALDRGHVVTVIVRHPEKLEKREGLTAKAGDIYDTASFATLIRGNEAFISAFNPGWKNPNLYDDQVRGTAYINGINRYYVLCMRDRAIPSPLQRRRARTHFTISVVIAACCQEHD
jgi:putative NADH-flavin reductase